MNSRIGLRNASSIKRPSFTATNQVVTLTRVTNECVVKVRLHFVAGYTTGCAHTAGCTTGCEV